MKQLILCVCGLFIFFDKTSPYLSVFECIPDKIITKYNLINTIALSKRNLKSIIYVTWTFFIHSHSLYCRLFIIFCIVTPELIVLLKGVVEGKGVGRERPLNPGGLLRWRLLFTIIYTSSNPNPNTHLCN